MSISERERSEKGQSLVEFAVGVIVLLFLIAGAVDLGRLFFTYMALRDASQEGAAYGSVNPMKGAAIRNRVINASDNPLDLNAGNVNVTITAPNPCQGNTITIGVEYTYTVTTPFIGALIGSQTIPLRAEAIDTILTPPCSP